MMLRTNWYTPVHPQISAVQDTGASLGSPGAVEWTYVSELLWVGPRYREMVYLPWNKMHVP